MYVVGGPVEQGSEEVGRSSISSLFHSPERSSCACSTGVVERFPAIDLSVLDLQRITMLGSHR